MTVINLKILIGIAILSTLLISGCGEKGQETTSKSDDPVKADNKEVVKKVPGKQSTIVKPDFSSFKDVKAKKKAFFNYMYVFVERVNNEVLERRMGIDEILKKSPSEITDRDRQFIDEMSELYLKDHDSNDTLASAKVLQSYIRVIPPSLALAQAANESAWGTSRFATKADNFFGQWCFKKGCGLVPKQRSSGQVHEVRMFESAEGSVRSYLRNLNTHYTYKELREIRDKLVNKNKLVTGIELAEGLKGYSERGEEYVKELQSMIRVNKLVEYDRKFWESVE